MGSLSSRWSSLTRFVSGNRSDGGRLREPVIVLLRDGSSCCPPESVGTTPFRCPWQQCAVVSSPPPQRSKTRPTSRRWPVRSQVLRPAVALFRFAVPVRPSHVIESFFFSCLRLRRVVVVVVVVVVVARWQKRKGQLRGWLDVIPFQFDLLDWPSSCRQRPVAWSTRPGHPPALPAMQMNIPTSLNPSFLTWVLPRSIRSYWVFFFHSSLSGFTGFYLLSWFGSRFDSIDFIQCLERGVLGFNGRT